MYKRLKQFRQFFRYILLLVLSQFMVERKGQAVFKRIGTILHFTGNAAICIFTKGLVFMKSVSSYLSFDIFPFQRLNYLIAVFNKSTI